MNHKKCPQCKNLISVTAPTCLYCGRPNKFITNNYVKTKWNKKYNKKNIFTIPFIKKLLITFSVILIIILIY